MTITNRIIHETIESDLVYPLDKGYYYIAKLDKDWVEDKLAEIGVERIANKYAVNIEVNNGTTILVVNHDNEYYIISK